MIQKIHADNLKGQTFAHTLAPLVLFTGRNFAGKTARMDALRLALLGKLYELGGRPGDTFQLSSAQSMAVGFESDFGTMLRRFSMEGKSVKSTVTSDIDESVRTQIENTPLFNVSSFFEMTDSERLRFVLANCPVVGGDPEGIATRVRSLEIEDRDEHTDKCLDECIADIRNALKGGVISGITQLTATETGILSQKFSRWNGKAKDSVGATRTLTELKLREEDCSPETIAALDTKIRVLKDSFEAAVRRNSQLSSEQAKIVENNAVIVRLRATIAQPSTLDAELAEIEERMKPHLAAADSNLEAPSNVTVTEKYKVAKAAAAHAIQIGRELTKARENMEGLESAESCPFCKCSGDGWKVNLRALYQSQIAELQPRLDLRAEESKKINAEYDEINRQYALDLANYKASSQARAIVNQLKEAAASIRTKIAERNATRAAAEDALSRLSEKQPIDEAELEASAEAIRQIRAEQAAADAKRDAALKLEQDIKRAADAALEHVKASGYARTIKAVGKKLKEIQQEIVTNTYKSLMGAANQFAEGILKTPLEVHGDEIGRWEGSTFVTHHTMSGTERAITHIAVAAALSSTFPLKLVLLDELARADDENTIKLMANFAKCVKAGIVEQVIAIDVRPRDYADWIRIAL